MSIESSVKMYNARGWSLALMNSIASSKLLTVTIGRIGAKISLKEYGGQGDPPPRSRNPGHSLAHQRIIGTNIPYNGGGNVFCLAVGVSAEDDSPLGIIQQLLDPVETSVSWETSDLPGFGRAIRVKFMISKHLRSAS